MKSLIIILLLSVPALMQAQTEIDLLKAKSEVVRKKIQKQLEYSILDYKQLTCPEIDRESYMEYNNGLVFRKQPKGFFFPTQLRVLTTNSYLTPSYLGGLIIIL